MSVFKKVVKVEYRHTRRYNRHDAIETLECGHTLLMSESQSGAKKRKCKSCERDTIGR